MKNDEAVSKVRHDDEVVHAAVGMANDAFKKELVMVCTKCK